MAEIIPIIIKSALELLKSEWGVEAVNQNKAKTFNEEDEEDGLMKVDPNSVDEWNAAIHCLGYLIWFVPHLMQPYLEETLVMLDKNAFWYHPNVRLEIISSYTQIILGLASLQIGDPDNFEYIVGNEADLGIYCNSFLEKFYYPHVDQLFYQEEDETILEQML